MGSEINLVSIIKISCLKLLLKYGAKPDARDRSGLTPLMKAARHPQGYAAVKLLIEHGADVNNIAGDRHDYRTVLHHSIFSGNIDLIRLLLTSGARYPSLEFDKPSPLDIAIISGRHDIVRLLIEFDADVNSGAHTTIGQPLHTALTQRVDNKRAIVRALLAGGADPNSRTTSNRHTGPPLHDYLHSTRQYGPGAMQQQVAPAAEDHHSQQQHPHNSRHHSQLGSCGPDLEIVRTLLMYGARVVLKTASQHSLGLVRSLERVQDELSVDLLCLLIDAAEQIDWFMMSRVIYACLRQANRARTNELFDPSSSADMTPERLSLLLADRSAHHYGVPRELVALIGRGRESSGMLTLKQSARLHIRRHLCNAAKTHGAALVERIQLLPVPTILVQYLLFLII